MQDGPMDFTWTEHMKTVDMVSDSTFQLIFKKYFLLSFSVVSNNNW